MTQIVTLHVRLEQRQGATYRLTAERSSRALALSKEELHRRQLACGCSGSAVFPNHHVVIERVDQGDVAEFLGQVAAITPSRERVHFRKCEPMIASHHFDFDGHVKWSIYQGSSSHVWYLKREYQWEPPEKNCDVRFTGEGLGGKNDREAFESWGRFLGLVDEFLERELGRSGSASVQVTNSPTGRIIETFTLGFD